MFLQCREYLIAKLKACGLKTKPITARKELERSGESHLGAVIFESDSFSRNGSKRIYKDKNGASVKRRKVFDREMTFHVILSDYKPEVTSSMLDHFLAGLDRGIEIDGNFVPLEVDGSAWEDEEDSILHGKLGVQLQVRFLGGVYKDTSFAKVRELEVTAIKKEDLPHGK